MAVEKGSAATRGLKLTPCPFTVAVADRSSQSPGIWNGSFLASTPASRNRSKRPVERR